MTAYLLIEYFEIHSFVENLVLFPVRKEFHKLL